MDVKAKCAMHFDACLAGSNNNAHTSFWDVCMKQGGACMLANSANSKDAARRCAHTM